MQTDTNAKSGALPTAWMALLFVAGTSHGWAWIKVMMTTSINDFAIINDRTRFCYYVFSVVQSHWWIWFAVISICMLFSVISVRRGYDFTTRMALFAPILSVLVLYSMGMMYLGGKFLN